MPYRCPQCHESRGLWQEISISGWQSLDEQLEPTGERGDDWEVIGEGDLHGCGECGWEGLRSQFEKLGIDGKPLPFVHDGQLGIEAA